MKLSDEQIEGVRLWAAEGATLNDIQKRLKDEYEVVMTYMDVRFLISDLGIDLEDTAGKAAAAAKLKDLEAQKPKEVPAEGGGETADGAEPPGGGNVTLTVDSIAVPGTVLSGRATFSDGKGAKWYLDQSGRLGFEPDEEGYRPSEPDVMAFQRELQTAMSKEGY